MRQAVLIAIVRHAEHVGMIALSRVRKCRSLALNLEIKPCVEKRDSLVCLGG